MLREGGKGLSQDAVPGVRLEGGVGEAEQEMLVAVCLRPCGRQQLDTGFQISSLCRAQHRGTPS